MYTIKQTLLLLVIASSTMAIKLEADSNARAEWRGNMDMGDHSYAQTEWRGNMDMGDHSYAQAEADSDAQMDWAWFDEVTDGKAYA